MLLMTGLTGLRVTDEPGARHPPPQEVPHMTPDQTVALDSLVAQQYACVEAGRQLRERAQTCRELGVTFNEIGVALGTSRQAAWERFHVVVEPAAWPRQLPGARPGSPPKEPYDRRVAT